MKENVLEIQKKLGETPLEAMKGFVFDNPKYDGVPMTYAGRLDPMAEGKLLILFGDECKNKDKYLGMDKEYEFEILFGFKTDSYDLLGISEEISADKGLIKKDLEKELILLVGKRKQKYPPFSSKTIKGVPLFKKTRDGDVFDLPEREIEIYSVNFLGFREINQSNLLKEIKRRISFVRGDFRQEIIIKKWEENLSKKKEEDYLIAKVKIKCSSGTYVRSLVNELSFHATTFSINRTKIY